MIFRITSNTVHAAHETHVNQHAVLSKASVLHSSLSYMLGDDHVQLMIHLTVIPKPCRGTDDGPCRSGLKGTLAIQ